MVVTVLHPRAMSYTSVGNPTSPPGPANFPLLAFHWVRIHIPDDIPEGPRKSLGFGPISFGTFPPSYPTQRPAGWV